jgi:DNA-binding NtrC family response regulator
MPAWVVEDSTPRVLVEATDFAKQAALANILADRGYSVRTCGGPEATDDRCPLVESGQCDGVALADVVVHSMRRHDPRNREVLEKILERYPDTPVVVEAPRPLVERHPDDYAECTVIFQPLTRTTLLDAVEAALCDTELST